MQCVLINPGMFPLLPVSPFESIDLGGTNDVVSNVQRSYYVSGRIARDHLADTAENYSIRF